MIALTTMLALGITAASAAADWTAPIFAAARQFHSQQITAALQDYRGVLAGYPSAPEQVAVQVQGYGARDKLVAATVSLVADIAFQCADANSACEPRGQTAHPLPGCTYQEASLHLQQTSEIICIPAKHGSWDCQMDWRQSRTRCSQTPADSPSQCPAYETLLTWGQQAQAPNFHDGLLGFLAHRPGEAANPAPLPSPATPAPAHVADD